MTAAQDLLDRVAEFFVAHEMQFGRSDRELYLETRVESDGRQWLCFAHTFEDRNQLVFYSVCPERIPQARHSDMAEYACALNYELAFGNLEMSAASGELRLCTAVEAADEEITPALIAPVVFNNIAIMDDLLPILLGLMGGDLTPGAALEQTKRLMDHD
jgi:hypothetical protein